MPNTAISLYGFVVDSNSVVHSSGKQFDWDKTATARQNGDLKKEVTAGEVVAITPAGKLVPRADTVAMTSLVDDGSSEVTATKVAHGFADGSTVVIAGATESRFNGTFVITLVDADSFTYVPDSTSAGSATGSPVASYRAYGVLASSAREDAPEHALSGYGVLVGGRLFESSLPDATGTVPSRVLPAAYKTEMATTGAFFNFEQYEDSRLS